MQFSDRYQAGRMLARALGKYKNENGIVLGVPRGGVPVAYEIAAALQWPLEIVLSKKIGHPSNSEYAIGAAGLTDRIVHYETGVTPEYVEAETTRIRRRMQEMLRLYMGNHKLTPLSGIHVIVADDGIATGNTLMMSVKLLREQQPIKIIVAAPVASEEAWLKLQSVADELIVLYHTHAFSGVGQFYENFTPTEDDEVRKLLELNRQERGTV